MSPSRATSAAVLHRGTGGAARSPSRHDIKCEERRRSRAHTRSSGLRPLRGAGSRPHAADVAGRYPRRWTPPLRSTSTDLDIEHRVLSTHELTAKMHSSAGAGPSAQCPRPGALPCGARQAASGRCPSSQQHPRCSRWRAWAGAPRRTGGPMDRSPDSTHPRAHWPSRTPICAPPEADTLDVDAPPRYVCSLWQLLTRPHLRQKPTNCMYITCYAYVAPPRVLLV